MKIYHCSNCDYPVYFENVVCNNCSSYLGYEPEEDAMKALAPGDGPWMCGPNNNVPYIYCDNHKHQACNWLIPQADETGLCDACDLNRTVPDLSDPEKLHEWQELELAKHRLVYALQRLGLPVQDKMSAPNRGLAFDFLADTSSDQVMTGHDEGLITLNVKEADPVQRESTRVAMHEKYRTLIGHFRHEVGHYYWDLLISENQQLLNEFRRIFGDDRDDYGEALQRHYKNGPPANWQSNFISEYATMHPWEDWAETWAHYLHLIDMLETAHAFGMEVNPAGSPDPMMSVKADFDPYQDPDMEKILKSAVPLTFAINSLNRGMGRPDLYPFVINASVREKLEYVNRVVRASAGSTAART